MEKTEFLKLCSNTLKNLGFRKNGSTHFYKDLSDDIMIVIGLCHSKHHSQYWFDGGIVIKPINKHMPYPKFHAVNIRKMDIGIGNQYYLDYLNMDCEQFRILEKSIQHADEFYSACSDKAAIIENIMIPKRYEMCKDYDLPEYLDYAITSRDVLPDESQVGVRHF
jgi:hypothetical protein